MIKIIDTNNKNFFNLIKEILDYKKIYSIKLENFIKNIIFNIKTYKEKALLYYCEKFDKNKFYKFEELKIKNKEIENSYFKLNKKKRFLIELIKNRIEIYHIEQKNKYFNNFKNIEYDGNFMGQKLIPIEKAGFYIPGGKAIYPSTIFMNIIPSNVIGVKENIVTVPVKNNNINNLLLYSFLICNVKNVYKIGGAHAIVSMALGVKEISNVNKIFGPGNIYVSLAKKLLYGKVGIDVLAGPSELLILIDENIKFNDFITFDIFSQSEHDELAQSILVTHNINLIFSLKNSIKKYLSLNYKKTIITKSINNRSFLIKTYSLIESCNIVNYIAPEHLIILSNNFKNIFKYIKNSGSVFLNNFTSESFGDYSAGVNHVLPTNQSSKFSSSLGIYDFYKNINFLNISYKGFSKLKTLTSDFARYENLFAHSDSVNFR